MTSEDELLDQILAHLRSEPTLEMPRGLAAPPKLAAPAGLPPNPASHARDRPWLVVAGRVLAASLVGILLWRVPFLPAPPTSGPQTTRQPRERPRESDIVVRDVDLTAPLSQLEANLDQLDISIADLQSQAALLDARRLADRLLAQN